MRAGPLSAWIDRCKPKLRTVCLSMVSATSADVSLSIRNASPQDEKVSAQVSRYQRCLWVGIWVKVIFQF